MKAHIAVLIAAALLVACAAQAAEPVIVAGQIACRLADPGTFGSVCGRVSAVDKRLAEALSVEDVGEPKMTVAKKGGLWSVIVGKTLLVSVYPLDAKHYNLPADKVAALWSVRFKELLPLAEPVLRYRARQAAGGHLPAPGSQAKAARPPVKVPQEHWGLVDRYLALLWQARSAPEELREPTALRTLGEILEISSLHYFVPPRAAQGDEPGSCSALRDCAGCQADMAAAIEVPDESHEAALALARQLSADPDAVRAVSQSIEYCQRIDQGRLMAERVRIAWTLWKRLQARAEALGAVDEPATCATEPESGAAGTVQGTPAEPATGTGG